MICWVLWYVQMYTVTVALRCFNSPATRLFCLKSCSGSLKPPNPSLLALCWVNPPECEKLSSKTVGNAWGKLFHIMTFFRGYNDSSAISGLVPSQRETVILCNDVSHWLGANLELTLYLILYLDHDINNCSGSSVAASQITSNSTVFFKIFFRLTKPSNLPWLVLCWVNLMMTSSNGSIFRVTGPLCGEFTGHRWIPLTKANKAELWCFLWSAPWINTREAGDLRRHHTSL